MSSKSELERALNKLNTAVDLLGDEPSAELVDALVQRSEILRGLDYDVSSVEDLEDAVSMIETLRDRDEEPPADICFSAYALLGSSYCDDDDDGLSYYYGKAAQYLGKLSAGDVTIATLCCNCASDCLDLADTRSCRIFLEYPLSLRGSHGISERNVVLNTLFILGQANIADNDIKAAMSCLAELIEIATPMLERNQVAAPDIPLMSYLYLADYTASTGNLRAAKSYIDAASVLISDSGLTKDMPPDFITDVHGELARLYGLIDDETEARAHSGYRAAMFINGTLPRDEE